MSDEPIFEAEESGLWSTGGGIDLPDSVRYVGAIPQGAIDSEMPTIYLDAGVAARLQAEGQRSIAIDKEVAGILLGIRSPDSQQIRVSHIAVAEDEDSSPVHFKFTYSVWDDLIDQMEELSREAGQELLLLGWYHTHPNMSVFLSRYDLRTHRDFHRPYQFALVLAPQRGTERTSVGFFCNRGEGTPLLPGLCLYGEGSEAPLPWDFVTVASEDFEEGEVEEESTADESLSRHQIGEVGRANPHWLTLGEDAVEGPVLPILEGMACSMMDSSRDRIGVLLGTKCASDQVHITRVRFMGRTALDRDLERGELLGALRFMAQAFPATGEPKILGIVRIVAPRRLREGSVFDSREHNLAIAQLLSEVGYDVREVPFQVGLVLFPGIDPDRLLFQVFAQRQGTRPVFLKTFGALLPPTAASDGVYAPLPGPEWTLEQRPSMRLPLLLRASAGAAPTENLADTLRESVSAIGSSMDGATDRLLEPSPMLARVAAVAPVVDNHAEDTDAEGSADGIDWDQMARDEAQQQAEPGAFRRAVVLVGLFLLALVVGGGFLMSLVTGDGPGRSTIDESLKDGSAQPAEPGSGAGGEGAAPKATAALYKIDLLGCGRGPCSPFPAGSPHVQTVDLVRVHRQRAYLDKSLKPIEVWLERTDLRHPRRVRLTRRADGRDVRIYEVSRAGRDWARFWGGGESFEATLYVLPQGGELEGEGPGSELRATQTLRLRGPQNEEKDSKPTSDASEMGDESEALLGGEARTEVGKGGKWSWRGSGNSQRLRYDSTKRAFATKLIATGGEATGTWVLTYEGSGSNRLAVTTNVSGLRSRRGSLDLTRAVTELMREPTVNHHIGRFASEKSPAKIRIQPPDDEQPLLLTVGVTGVVAANAVEHKVCLMMSGPAGQVVTGRAGIAREGTLRPTFEAGAGRGECGDGGNTGRWMSAKFGPGRTLLQFINEGSDEVLSASKGVVQKYRLPAKWSKKEPSCLAITIYLAEGGWRQAAPKVVPLYELSGDQCE